MTMFRGRWYCDYESAGPEGAFRCKSLTCAMEALDPCRCQCTIVGQHHKTLELTIVIGTDYFTSRVDEVPVLTLLCKQASWCMMTSGHVPLLSSLSDYT